MRKIYTSFVNDTRSALLTPFALGEGTENLVLSFEDEQVLESAKALSVFGSFPEDSAEPFTMIRNYGGSFVQEASSLEEVLEWGLFWEELDSWSANLLPEEALTELLVRLHNNLPLIAADIKLAYQEAFDTFGNWDVPWKYFAEGYTP